MYQKVKGFHDIFGPDIRYWHMLESKLAELYKGFGFDEFRLPILEKTAVFNRGIGETTDIVEKEMFTFTDSDELVSLRPEGTASLMRAYIENGLHNPPGVKKYYYMGNMFRRERPQKGRFRQFSQSGVEVLECDSPLLDAEVITLLYSAAKVAGIEDCVRMEINSIGCPECRPSYRAKLVEYFTSNIDGLCADCKRRLDKNPMRILDCKNEACKAIAAGAPLVADYLCAACVDHFDNVKKYLNIFKTPYTVNVRMVRGLDYYVRTAFELVTDMLGAASAVGGGGRYDGLVKIMGGKDAPGIGFAIGMDRVVSLMKERMALDPRRCDFFILFFDDMAAAKGIEIVEKFRANGFVAEYDYDMASMKSQMKKADKANARYAIIMGSDELAKSSVSVKSLETGEQTIVEIDKVYEFCIKL